jgi:hypothetical protein
MRESLAPMTEGAEVRDKANDRRRGQRAYGRAPSPRQAKWHRRRLGRRDPPARTEAGTRRVCGLLRFGPDGALYVVPADAGQRRLAHTRARSMARSCGSLRSSTVA